LDHAAPNPSVTGAQDPSHAGACRSADVAFRRAEENKAPSGESFLVRTICGSTNFGINTQ